MSKVFKVGLVAPTHNGIVLTANATGFSIAGGTTSKTLTINNSITLAGTDSTTITLPATSGTVALNNQQFYIGTQAININATSGSVTTLPGVSSINGASVPSSGTLAINPTTTIGDIIYASATGTPGTLTRLAGNTATQTSFLASTGNGTTNTTTSFISSTGTAGSNVVLANSPTLVTPKVDSISSSTGAGATATLFGDVTTGSITIGGALTTGTLNIDSFSPNTHTVNIGTGSLAGSAVRTINIGINGGTGTQTIINLGPVNASTNNYITLNGATYFAFNGTNFLQIYNPATNSSTIQSPGTNATSTQSYNLSIVSGNALGTTSASGNISIDAGTATGTAGTISIGTGNASALTIGRSGITTTVNSVIYATGGDSANNSSIRAVGYNQRGGTGYHGFLDVTNTYGSATTPNKYFRLNSAGGLEIINSAYNTVIFTLSDAGNLTVPGTISGGIVTGAANAAASGNGANLVGYMGTPQNLNPGLSYNLTFSDMGKQIYFNTSGSIAIPANTGTALPIGFTCLIVNQSGGSFSITINTDTLYFAGSGNTGTRTLANFGMATLTKVTATSWFISGAGLT